MAGLIISLVDSGEGQFGDLRYQIADVTFDSSYPTGGEALPVGTGATPSVGGIQNVLGMQVIGVLDATSAAVVLQYKPSTGKILVMRVGTLTPAGTISAPTFTGSAASLTATSSKPTFLVTKGAITASTELGLSADSATATVNNNAIAATLTLTPNGPVGTPTITCGAYTPAGTNSAPTFTGTATAQAGLAEVSNAVNLSAVTQRCMFVGI